VEQGAIAFKGVRPSGGDLKPAIHCSSATVPLAQAESAVCAVTQARRPPADPSR
jgi:hypothetical protein